MLFRTRAKLISSTGPAVANCLSWIDWLGFVARKIQVSSKATYMALALKPDLGSLQSLSAGSTVQAYKSRPSAKPI